MNYQQSYRRLISGRTSGLGARMLRLLLTVPAVVYTIAICLRNFLYSNGWLKVHHVDAAVISVGNITAGGTGKTPLVIWLCNHIAESYNCAILTRGYKAEKRGTIADEPAILAENCPQAKAVINPDRFGGATEAIKQLGADVLVMDDGFQHRRLGRDLDIVTIDATVPFGYGKVLPAGLLREPLCALKRADAVVITRCDKVDEVELGQLEEKIKSVKGDMIISRSIHSAVCAKSTADEQITLKELKGKKIFAFCAIGNPEAFLATVDKLGAGLVGSGVYNDHHHYSDSDITYLHSEAESLKADLMLTTQKDWVKIGTLEPSIGPCPAIPLAYLEIELKLLSGEDGLKQLIEKTLAGKIPVN